MWRWFKGLEGWQRASIIGLVIGLTGPTLVGISWLGFGFELPAGFWTSTAREALVSYLLAMWIWGMANGFAGWKRQSRPLRWRMYRQWRLWILLLGGAEIGLRAVPKSLKFLTTLPLIAVRGAGAQRNAPSERRTDGVPAATPPDEPPTANPERIPFNSAEPRSRIYLPGHQQTVEAATEDGQLLVVSEREPRKRRRKLWTPRR